MNHEITLEEAAELTANYRSTLMAALNGFKAGAFSKSAIESLINQDGVVDVRIYLGAKLDPTVSVQYVIVGVDVNGNDITTGIILDESLRCPPDCSAPNQLNS